MSSGFLHLRGRRPGEQHKKCKAEDELSTNPHSVKRRQRDAALDEHEAKIDKAKNADHSTISTALSKLWKTANYQAADDQTKKEMEDNVKEKVKQQRYIF